MTYDPYNISFEDVERSAEKWGRYALRLPGHCVIVLDNTLIGEDCIRQFSDDPHGYNQARRFAVRLEFEDIESDLSLEELEAEYNKELGE